MSYRDPEKKRANRKAHWAAHGDRQNARARAVADYLEGQVNTPAPVEEVE